MTIRGIALVVMSVNVRSSQAGAVSRRTNPDAGRTAGCQVGELFAMLGQTHMLRILDVMLSSPGTPMRFRDLQDKLGISPKTLTQRLRTLVEAGFLTRRSYNEIPPRVDYEVTAKAMELAELFPILARWAGHNTMTAVPTVSVVGKVRRPAPAA